MILSEAAAKDLTAKVLKLSKADSCMVSISGGDDRHIRFAQNMATTSGAPSDISIAVQSNFGKRTGSASGSELTDAALAELVAASENTAKLAPESEEFMPPLGPQQYAKGTSYFSATASMTSAQLATAVAPVLAQAAAKGLQASGFIDVSSSFSSYATSKGLWVYDQSTDVLHTVSARTPDGTGSGWAGTTVADFGRLDSVGMGKVAIDKALKSQKPTPLAPGKYTVILEPSAIADLIGMMISDFDQRSADEGRNFATKKGGGSRVGEKLFGDNITIFSDPADPLVPGGIYSTDGLPAQKTMWVENGVLQNLQCGRFWAQKNNRAPVPSPTTLTFAGGNTSTDEMIQQTKRGLLITRFWYIREVDPETVLLTGLTRDGVFLIENGAITRPVQNFRFNESPVAMLNRVLALGPSVRAYGEDSAGTPLCMPTLLVDGFTLSSVSDAV